VALRIRTARVVPNQAAGRAAAMRTASRERLIEAELAHAPSDSDFHYPASPAKAAEISKNSLGQGIDQDDLAALIDH
jgi:hypothetical protein